MALNTAGDLIAFCLRTAGVNGIGQTANAIDAADGLVLLQAMLGQWQRRRWLCWSLADTAVTSTGAATYTVGPGGAFNVPRPDNLNAAFVRMLNSGALPVDLSLSRIGSREDWSGVALKSLATFPSAYFYESSYPLGVLHPWPIPPVGQFELHIVTKVPLPAVLALTDAIVVPPEYQEALIYSLAVRFAMNWGLQPQPGHVAAMKAALSTIRVANTQIGELGMPAGAGGRRGSGQAAGSSPSFQSGQW